MQAMQQNAKAASDFLKSLANPHRLAVLCLLLQGEKSVTQLCEVVDISQTSMSNHLAKLREEELVGYRREHRTLYYYINNPHVSRIIGVLYDIYCKTK